jgi:hypothetical protein
MLADPDLRERECLLTGNLVASTVAVKRERENKRMGFISEKKGEGKKQERSVEGG